MAGIGFELRRALARRYISSVGIAFGYSLLLVAGPYLISILTILSSYYLIGPFVKDRTFILQFQVLVTYMVAFSLILTGPSQLMMTRFVADRLFEEKYDLVLSNLVGNMLLNMLFGFAFSMGTAYIFFNDMNLLFISSSVFSFTILCGLWIVNIVLTGLKRYKWIVFSYALGYAVFIVFAYLFAFLGLAGMTAAFLLGQSVLFFALFGFITKSIPSKEVLRFDFLDRNLIKLSLIPTGLFYNLGIWADKFVFWFDPSTSKEVIGSVVRASPIYDIPMFLAYISIAPGLAMFFLKLEVEFAEYYERYYRSVREGAHLQKIYELGNDMIESARAVLFDVLRIQGIAFVVFTLFAIPVFKLFKISLLYIPLFEVLMLGTFLQLLFMTLFALFTYFDRRKESLFLTFLFFSTNLILTLITQFLGPYYYGYGFVASLFITNIVAFLLMRRFLNEIHYRTFMFA
ncbi:MAG: hypothetical protein D6674_05935 [Acidobacteria bacterium]|jgi:uncharacterized membrane protein|nr:MAG: hypothetical protein D6674_05935 [Acidobacteriota bacterium]